MSLVKLFTQVLTKYIAIVFLMGGVLAVAAARAQPQQPPIPKGLFTRLIEIKYTAELYLSSALKESTYKLAENKELRNNETEKNINSANMQTKLDSALAIYNTLRWKVDGLVYQLSGDLVAANSPRKMRLLNKWCLEQPEELETTITSSEPKSKRSIFTYTLAIAEIDAFYQKQIAATMYASKRTINLSTNVFYLLKDSYTIVKGLSDMKTQKTMALIELLDHTRLLSPGEVAKQGK